MDRQNDQPSDQPTNQPTDLVFLVGVLVDPGVRCAENRDEEVEHHDGQDYQVRRQENRRYAVELAAGELVKKIGLPEHGFEHVLPDLRRLIKRTRRRAGCSFYIP